MLYIGKSCLTLLLVLGFTVEAGYRTLPYASAEPFVHPAAWQASFVQATDIGQIEPPVGDGTCGISELFAFAPEEIAIIVFAVEAIPCELLSGLEAIVIFDDLTKSRALAGAHALHLRSDFFSLPEAKNVLIHELGHIADLSGLKSATYDETSSFYDGNIPVYADDPSLLFYTISWKNTFHRHANARREDFVSGYAFTNPFEDFAESFLFYIAHANTFRAYAEKNPVLAAKYDFFKTYVFDGVEFNTGEVPTDLYARNWDATKM